MAVAREKSKLVPHKAIPTGNLTPLVNTAIDISPVITIAHKLQFQSEALPQFRIISLIDMIVVVKVL